MGVELPQVLRVVAHEVRGALSVIQGYLRLMIRQRDEAAADLPMLRAMLDASGRLTALARHASDISTLLREPAAPAQAVPLAEVLAAVGSRPGPLRIELDEDGVPATHIATADKTMLEFALGTIAERVARNAGADAVTVGAASGPQPGIRLTVRPAGAVGTSPPEDFALLAFDQGGSGLALVLASFVLDSHGASATVGNQTGAVHIQFPPHGGVE